MKKGIIHGKRASAAKTLAIAVAAIVLAAAGTSANATLPIVTAPTSALSASSPSATSTTTFSLTSDGHIHAVTNTSGAWSTADITAVSNAVAATPGTALASVVEGNGNLDVYYFGPDQAVHGISQNGSTWIADSSTAAMPPPGNPAALTAMWVDRQSPYVGRVEIFYPTAGGHIEELVPAYGSAGWAMGDISADLNGGTFVPASFNTSIAAFPYEDFYERVYYIDTSGHVEELASGPELDMSQLTVWTETDATSRASGTVAVSGSAMTAVWALNNGPRIYYFDANQHVRELAYGINNIWHNTDITAAAGGAVSVSGSAMTTLSLSSANSPNLQIFYLSYEGHIRRLNFGADGWSAQDITTMACGTAAAAGSALTSFDNPASYGVLYASADSHLREVEVTNAAWYAIDANGAGTPQGCTSSGGSGGGGGGGGGTHLAN